MIQILSSCEKYWFIKSASPCRSRHLELQLKSARKWTGPTMIFTNGTEFSGHFGWNGKRGIHLSISIFSGMAWTIWTSNGKFRFLLSNGTGQISKTSGFRENMGLVGVPILTGSQTWFQSLLFEDFRLTALGSPRMSGMVHVQTCLQSRTQSPQALWASDWSPRDSGELEKS